MCPGALILGSSLMGSPPRSSVLQITKTMQSWVLRFQTICRSRAWRQSSRLGHGHGAFPVPRCSKAHRLRKLQQFGANAWRTAHNPPNEALLNAADRLGILVWDENHRNGQDSEMEAQHATKNDPKTTSEDSSRRSGAYFLMDGTSWSVIGP